jgi:hypothetical protein
MTHLKSLIVLASTATSLAFAGSLVKVEGQAGAYQLIKDSKPYFVMGAGGGGPKDLLKALGGNSFRTWGSDDAAQQLDEAQKLGLTVTIGHWLGHQQHGFNYGDPAALARQKEDVRKTVLKHKDHPALLMWALGNEMEMNCSKEEAMWNHINDLALMVKSLDPHHPVMTVIAEIPDAKVQSLHRLCPAIDVVGINTYGGAASIPERWRKAGGTKPYIITEFGPPGQWEVKKNAFGCPPEMTSTEKGKFYGEVYRKVTAADKGKLCLGLYAFTWGYKVEATPTWYGLLLPDNSKLAATEAMQECWGESKVGNRVPCIEKLEVSKDVLASEGETFTASTSASDPDNDPLTWKWILMQEAAHYDVTGVGEPTPPGFADAIISGQGTPKVTVKPPGGGKYRLYAYVFDGKKNAAYANCAIQGAGAEIKAKPAQVKFPCAVFASGEPERWIASGYMGNHGAIKMELGCTEKPHSGATCIKVSYNASDNWAGVMWQHPANDWGKQAGGFNLEGATMLVFWARGETGGEKVSFAIGGLTNTEFSDSAQAELKDVVLKNVWTRYRIPLDGRDMQCIKTGFKWVIGNPGKPIAFYLDDIYYTQD